MRIVFAVMLALMAQPALAMTPNLALETQIAYQQGQFAGLYERCGSEQEKIVIGGSAAQWRNETFAGYHGSAAERQQLDQAYISALSDIKADPTVCREWVKQAAAVWRSIARLTMYGTPVTFKQ